MATINFNTAASTAASSAKAHAVYTRPTWGDSWIERPDISCVQCVWSATPNASTATLIRDYGRVILPGAIATSDVVALDLGGHFVRIDWANDESGINYWLGIAESTANDPDGATDGTVPASGRQSYGCFGMERILQVAPVLDTIVADEATHRRTGGTSVFNVRGTPNRSGDKVDGAYVFDNDGDDHWSSRDIIEHLLTFHLPTETGLASGSTIPWTVANASLIPDWDSPELNPEGLTIYSILNRLLSSRMLLTWAVGFDNSNLTIEPRSLASSNVTLNDKTFAANATQHTVLYGSDPLTTGEISSDRSDMIDQVVIRGARRQSVVTLRANEELDKTWTANQLSEYNGGASGEANYSGLDQIDKRVANDSVRKASRLSDVFSRLELKPDWDFTTEDSTGEEPVIENVFPPLSGTDPHEPYLGSMRVLESLPLRSGFDYSGDISELTVRDDKTGQPPLVSLEIPETTDRIDVSDIGDCFNTLPENGETVDYTIATEIDPDDLSLKLKVNGAPQHVLGGVDFIPLDIDRGYLGDWSWIDTHATVTIEEDRYCECVEPSAAPTTDVVRRRVFHVGEVYQQIYVVPGTVVSVENFKAKTSDGGYLRDDTEKIEYLAKLLYAYHSTARKSVTITTSRRTGLANVGDMIATANGESIGAVITRIQIDAPLGNGQRQPRTTQKIVATSVPLDLLATLSIASKD